MSQPHKKYGGDYYRQKHEAAARSAMHDMNNPNHPMHYRGKPGPAQIIVFILVLCVAGFIVYMAIQWAHP